MEKSPHKFSEQFNKISFYVIAHADDWQLFMHPNVYVDLAAPGCKVVFIITTAGDAGMGEKYWAAREEGTKSSVRFCLAPLSVFREFSGEREFNDRTIHYWSVNNSTSYFLRLPDGNLDGGGFEANNFQSLAKLQPVQINAITTVDNSTTYHNWPEFVTILESIISFEGEAIPNRWIHYLNPDTAINPNDHPDHTATGNAVQSINLITGLHQLLFTGYNNSSAEENLSFTDLFWKAGMFAAYEKAVYDLCGYSTLKENPDVYVKWCCSAPKSLTILPTSYQ